MTYIATTGFDNRPFAEGRPTLLHVRFAGQSFDVRLSELDVGAAADDRQIKSALADHLAVTLARLEGHVIDRHPNGNLTLRPEAVFG